MSVNEYLLLIGIGPVQDFIRTARRCRDYWYGSRLLSDLAKIVAQAVEKQSDANRLIFPHAVLAEDANPAERREDAHVAVANKVLARVPDGCAARDAVEEARRAVTVALSARWDEIVAKVAVGLSEWDGLKLDLQEVIDTEMGREQLKELIEIQWVAVPIGVGYFEARRTAEQLLSARKSTRMWQRASWLGEEVDDAERVHGIPKSSLDGAREQVIVERARKKLAQRPGLLRELLDLRPNEGLCGPGQLKRSGIPVNVEQDDEPAHRHFHSTSHMAAAPLLTRMALRGADGGFGDFLETLRGAGVDISRFRVGLGVSEDLIRTEIPHFDGGASVRPTRFLHRHGHHARWGYDGSLVFEGRLLAEFRDMAMADRRREGKIIEALGDFLGGLGIRGEPCGYYAFLLADGDHMGRAFEGNRPEELRMKNDEAIDYHRSLAESLAGFAKEARLIVLRHGGSPIYAGGDDVSALLPLHTALDCARALRDLFGRTMEDALPGWQPEERPTLSAGLAFVHHTAAMSEARALAEDAERLAKDPAKGGRDALAIVADKRSGARLEIYGGWELADRLDGWCRLYRGGHLPRGAAFELEAALRPFELGEKKKPRADDPPETVARRRATQDAVRDLARRVIGRRQVARGEGTTVVTRDVRQLLSARIGDEPLDDPLDDVRQLSRELQVARLLSKALEDAWGPGTVEEAGR